MKSLRFATLVVALLAGASAVAAAQNGPPATQQGGRGFNRSLAGIELTEAQKTKVAQITAKYQPDLEAIRQSMQNGGDRAEAFQKMRALREKMSPEIRAVLTPAQQAIYDKNLAEQRARMEQRGGGPGR